MCRVILKHGDLYCARSVPQPMVRCRAGAGGRGGPYTLYLGAVETLGEEHDLADLLLFRRDHGDRPEQRLEVVRQLRAARVARVHGDEQAHARLQADLAACARAPAAASLRGTRVCSATLETSGAGYSVQLSVRSATAAVQTQERSCTPKGRQE
jgi:hypothetical protein